MSEKRTSGRAAAHTSASGGAGDSRTHAGKSEARAHAGESEARARATEFEAQAFTEAKEHARDILSGLRELGFRSDELRRAADFSETLRDATLEERMRAALGFLRPRSAFKSVPANHGAARS